MTGNAHIYGCLPPISVCCLRGSAALTPTHARIPKFALYLAHGRVCNRYEITSGGYIIRNTPIAHEFLVHWENYYLHRPRGFSSSDNGALHLALLQMLALPYEHCMQLYHNLEDNANRLVPFYNYIACTRKELGPARR